jgi:hypothetical protein
MGEPGLRKNNKSSPHKFGDFFINEIAGNEQINLED